MYWSSNVPIDWQTSCSQCVSGIHGFIISFDGFQKLLSYFLVLACRIAFSHVTCQNLWSFLFSLFGSEFSFYKNAFLFLIVYLFSHTSFFLSLLKPFLINSMHWLWDFWIISMIPVDSVFFASSFRFSPPIYFWVLFLASLLVFAEFHFLKLSVTALDFLGLHYSCRDI